MRGKRAKELRKRAVEIIKKYPDKAKYFKLIYRRFKKLYNYGITGKT